MTDDKMLNDRGKFPERWEDVVRLALTSRKIDNIQEAELAPTGKITYQFSSKGHELAQILLGMALNHPHDGATVYYRSRPFMLTCGLTPEEAFAADMALTGSPSEGRDVGVVYSLPPRSGPTVLPASGDVGAQYTPAVGWAQAVTYYRDQLGDASWEGAIAVALGGDGSVATNGFWSALTIATTLNLPMLFFIEDNDYGISVPTHFQTPGGDIAPNLESFKNLHILRGSGTYPPETADLVAEAVGYVRSGEGPCLLRLQVPRLTGHTFGEDQRAYKTSEQIEEEHARDPLTILETYFEGKMDWQAAQAEVEKDVRAALERAFAHPAPDLGEVTRHLFFSGKPTLVPPLPPLPVPKAFAPEMQGPRINMVEAVRRVIEIEMERNPHILVFGEDVGPRGGVHRGTLGLQAKFGEGRVFDTSLSEEGIMGRAIGLALAGLRPLPEIQFRKYADPATEQINDAGWIRWRTAGKFGAPIVLRIPIGYSKRTGDPWHSVCGEAIYAHTLGWKLAIPSNAADAAGLLRTALRSEDPTIFLEHRALMDTPGARRPYPGDDYALPLGKAAIVQKGEYLTIVTWGEMVYRCIEASKEYPGQVEIIDLRTIIPWDESAVLEAVKRTGKLLIAHEDTRTGGFAGEIAAVVSEQAFTDLDAPIGRIATVDVPIPYNIQLMDAVIPTVEHVRQKITWLLHW